MAEGGDDCVPIDLPETFENAAAHVKYLVGKLETNQLLEIYAYYKQAKEGPCNTPRPRWYEMQAKQKWDAWNALGDLDQETAMKRYVNIINEIDPGWDDVQSSENSNISKTNSSWVSVSCMADTDDFIADTDKTVFDWVKEGNVDKLLEYARNFGVKFVNVRDSEGMGLIHWAADRGNTILLKCLVGDLKADVDLKDQDGQTALHYAASCGHFDIVNYLLENGADSDTKDSEGLLPIDVASDSEIEKALSACNLSV